MSRLLQITVSDELHEALEKKAKALHVKPTQASLMAIVEWVAKPLPVQALRLVPPEQVPIIPHKEAA